MKQLLIVVVVFVLAVGSVAASVPDGPESVPDGPEVVPDGPEIVPDGPEVVPDGPELALQSLFKARHYSLKQ